MAERCVDGCAELELLHVRAAELVIDAAWNVRRQGGSASRAQGVADTHETLSDEQLRADIERHGLLQPIGVRLLGEGYAVRYGFRRATACLAIDAGYPVPCVVLAEQDDDEAAAFEDAAANLRENLHRRPVEAWEIAERLYAMQRARPELSTAELGEIVGLSQSYTSQLCAARRDAHPEVWRVFVAYGLRMGRTISWRDFRRVVRLPQSEQVAAWRELVTQTGNGTRPKARRTLSRDLRSVLTRIDELAADESDDYRRGARWALRLALGDARSEGIHRLTKRARRDDRRDDRAATEV